MSPVVCDFSLPFSFLVRQIETKCIPCWWWNGILNTVRRWCQVRRWILTIKPISYICSTNLSHVTKGYKLVLTNCHMVCNANLIVKIIYIQSLFVDIMKILNFETLSSGLQLVFVSSKCLKLTFLGACVKFIPVHFLLLCDRIVPLKQLRSIKKISMLLK